MGSLDYRGLVNEFRHNSKATIPLVALIIGAHAWGIMSNVEDWEMEPPDFEMFVIWHVYNCDPLDIPYFHDVPISARNQIKWYASCVSWNIFDNPKVIPLIFNVMVMPLAYLVATSLTKDRIIGIITIVALINNPLYTDWQGIATYDQMWTCFLLLAVLLIHKRVYGPISYALSILTKGLAIMYAPAILYTAWKKKDHLQVLIFGAITIFVIAFALQSSNVVGNHTGFFPERWEDAIYGNISVLWQVIPILAVFVALKANFTPKGNRSPNMDVVWVWLGMALVQVPLIAIFTMQDFYSYRYAPFAVFMSIFIGQVVVNLGNWIIQRQIMRENSPRL